MARVVVAVSDTQNEAILRALLAGRALTPLDALREFGVFRLGARIWDLKRAGYPIETELVHDGKKHWARYSIAKGTQLEMFRA